MTTRFLKMQQYVLLAACITALSYSSGCERKIVDIEGPDGSGIEVKENPVTNEKKVELKGSNDVPAEAP